MLGCRVGRLKGFFYFISYILLYTYNFILHILHSILNEQYINKLRLSFLSKITAFEVHLPYIRLNVAL